MSERLKQLRAELAQINEILKETKAELAGRLADIQAFETEFEAKVGPLVNQLESLEREIQNYKERIEMTRNKKIFGNAYLSVEEQYRRTWQTDAEDTLEPAPEPINSVSEKDMKQLYRQLARRFHPDLATNEGERALRNQKMAAINEAYAARSLVELVALAEEMDTTIDIRPTHPGQTEAQLVEILQTELSRCQRRLRQIERELRHLGHRPSVELSLAVKAARSRGQDLLAEIAADFERKIARKTVERNMLKTQFDQLGPDLGFIQINR